MRTGDKIGHYILLHLLGEGGMGQVWQANDSSRNRQVALKVLNPALASDHELVQRFLLEGTNLKKLNHKHIISAIDSGEDQGMFFLAMEIVVGKETEQVLNKYGPLDEQTVLALAHPLADALGYAWREHAILHRDIKPANIMIHANRHPYLMDFGIAKVMTEELNLTMTGHAVGTPFYMSPEQAMARKDIDCRSDIYSLGATLFHLLTGKVPHPGDNPTAVLTGLLKGPAPSVRDINQEISPECAELLKKMLEKDRRKRYQNWESVKKDIGRLLTDQPLSCAEEAPEPSLNDDNEPSLDIAPTRNVFKIILTIVALLALLAAIALAVVSFKRGNIFKDVLPSTDRLEHIK